MAKFKLTVPIDASAIPDVEKGHPLKVVARDAKGRAVSQVVALQNGKGSATFSFDEKPAGLRVFVGPRDAADDEMERLQTLSAAVAPRLVQRNDELSLAAIQITPFFWNWWRRWCRTFTIHGRVVCPDGSPVPGAKVCAYDVDFFWWWRNTQQIGCAVTDANGAFSITFRWCCGWWPWWWWSLRSWELDLDLYRTIVEKLPPELKVRRIPIPEAAPDPKFLDSLMSVATRRRAVATPIARGVLSQLLPRLDLFADAPAPKTVEVGRQQLDLGKLESARASLVATLPKIAEADALRIWPWWPWNPWFDCEPDVIFKVTQDCVERGTVIVDELPAQTRWNMDTTKAVTLIANDRACCIPRDDDAGENCLVITHVCHIAAREIAGNIGAPAAPQGYAVPGDRPFGGLVPVYGTTSTMDDIDYYQVETAFLDESVTPPVWGAWTPVPEAAALPIARSYLDFGTTPFTWAGPVFEASEIDGRIVYETIQHYQETHPPANWGNPSGGRMWVGRSRDLLINWLTDTTRWNDGLYRLRVKGFRLVGATLQEQPLNICNDDEPSELVVRIDNRLDPDPSHDTGPGHPCGDGTVHLCVTEPDTDIVSVRVLPGNRPLLPCEQETVSNTEQVEIIFFAHDPNGHLGGFDLHAFHSENEMIDLFAGPFTLSAAPGEGDIPTGFPATQRAYVPVADAKWSGGMYRVVVPASVFPRTCCYTLRLHARKRTIVSCHGAHENVSQYSFMIIRTP